MKNFSAIRPAVRQPFQKKKHGVVASTPPMRARIKNHASDLVSLSLIMVLMSQDMSAVGMQTCRPCPTPVLENHGDDKAPDGKIGHVLIAIYCSWTSSLEELSKNFGHL